MSVSLRTKGIQIINVVNYAQKKCYILSFLETLKKSFALHATALLFSMSYECVTL